jgi:hypothetical protein
MEELYHISCTLYTVGQIVPAPEITNYHLATIAQGHGWVDELLDANRPDDAPSRTSTLYAFANKNHCVSFFGARTCENGGPYLYKVEMLNPVKAPMTIVGAIAKDEYSNDDLVNAYWNHNEEWNAYEYLSSQMIILEIIPITREMRIMSNLTILIGEDLNKIRREFL